MKVRFNLNHPNRRETSIMLVYHFDSQKFKCSTGITVKTKQWSTKRQRASKASGYLQAEVINKQLSKIEQKFYLALGNISQSKKKLSRRAIKKEFDQLLNDKKPKEKIRHLSEYLNPFYEKKAQSSVSYSTLQTYNTVINHLEDWLGSKKLFFSDLQLDHYNRFADFLYKSGLADRTVVKHLKKLSAIVNYAIKDNSTDATQNPFSLSDLNLRIPKSDTVYLTLDEIDRLANLKLEKESLKRIRDLFVFLCLTGLRFNDAFKISPKSIRYPLNDSSPVPILHMSISKGGEKIGVPLSKTALSILKSYNYSFPKISNQKFNAYVKKICELGGINELVNKRRFVKNKATDHYLPKNKLVSSHTGRRSFITNALQAELSFDQVMRMTGHKSLVTFQKYIRHDEISNAEQLSTHSHFAH